MEYCADVHGSQRIFLSINPPLILVKSLKNLWMVCHDVMMNYQNFGNSLKVQYVISKMEPKLSTQWEDISLMFCH